jgi:glycylpeptide N-tetradecanoyltransferase
MLWQLFVGSIAPPKGLEWRNARGDIHSVHALLADSYVASDDGQLRMCYDRDTLRWMLDAPGTHDSLKLGLGVCGERTLVGFISAIPSVLCLHGERREAVEVTLLCTAKGWRRQGITPLLLAELRSRATDIGMRHAIYTTAQPRQLPLVCAACFHRPLQPRRLHRLQFWHPTDKEIGSGGSAPRLLGAAVARKARLPHPTEGVPRLRSMRASECTTCHEHLCHRLESFTLARSLSIEEFRHRFLGGPVRSFVAHNEDGRAIGFVSFMLVTLRTFGGSEIVQVQLLLKEAICAVTGRMCIGLGFGLCVRMG